MFFQKDLGYALYIKIEINSVFFYVLDINDSNSINDYLSRHGLQNKNFELLCFDYSEKAYSHVKKLLKFFNKNDIRVLNINATPSLLLDVKGAYSKDVLGLDNILYKEESNIIRNHAEDGFGGCLLITLILIGIVGVPLGGWGIPILLIAGFWWFSMIGKEIDSKIESSGITRRPLHPEKIQKIIFNLFFDIDRNSK